MKVDPFTKAAAFRAAADTDDLVQLAIRKTQFVGARARVQLTKNVRSGKPIDVLHTITKSIAPTLQQTLVISHLLGIRRFWLMRNKLDGMKLPAVALSTLADAVGILRQAANIDLGQLQKQYQTQALKIGFGVADHAQKQLHNTLADLVESGAHRKQAIQTLGAKMNSLGLTNASDFQLETIFRTQSSIAYQAGKYQAEQDPDIQDILWGYKYVTVGDDRVRESHAVLEGTQLPKTDPFWKRFYPPNGWNCRCQAIPIFEKREHVHPPREDNNGRPIAPDKGFNFNPGIVFGKPVDTSNNDDDTPPIKPPQPLPKRKEITPVIVIPPAPPKPQPEPTPETPKPVKVREQVKQLFESSHKPLFQGIAKAIKNSGIDEADKKAKDAKDALAKLQVDAKTIQDAGLAIAKLIKQTNPSDPNYQLLHTQFKQFRTKLADLNTQQKEVFDQLVEADKLSKAAKSKQRDDIFSLLKVKQPAKLTVVDQHHKLDTDIKAQYGHRLDLTNDPAARKIVTDKTQKAVDLVGSIADNSILRNGSTMQVASYVLKDDERAFAKVKSIFCTPDTPDSVFAHEFGHVLEEYSGTTDTIRKWISERAKGEQLTNLKDKFGGGYKQEEEGLADDWLKLTRAFNEPDVHAYYIGKSYQRSDGQYFATEVLSMGIEYLYKDAALFAKTDPEYFSLVIGILRGDIT